MMNLQYGLLIEKIRHEIRVIDNEKEHLDRVKRQTDRFADEIEDELHTRTREAEHIYDYWRGDEARKCVNMMLDESINNARQARVKVSIMYDNIEHYKSHLELKRERLENEITMLETQLKMNMGIWKIR